jgi:hypothetical protein
MVDGTQAGYALGSMVKLMRDGDHPTPPPARGANALGTGRRALPAASWRALRACTRASCALEPIHLKHVTKRLIVSHLVMKAKISCEHLSRLQKLILVMLCEPGLAVMKRWEFNRVAKRLYWGNTGRIATSDLSQAFERLENRQTIRRQDGRWVLTDAPPDKAGIELALLAWASDREFWAQFGLKGPPLEALGIKPASARSNTERQGVNVKFVGLD